MKIIISIGGGGMRGYVPTYVLSEIEKRSGYKAYEFADLQGGTSIGGIVSAISSFGYSAKKALELFTKYGPEIFKKRFLYFLRCPRYKEDGIKMALDELFQNSKLKDVKNKLLLTSYNISLKKPFFFKSYKNSTKNFLLKDATKATSAAETFFPWQVINDIAFSDGGTICNNPSSVIYNDYCKLFKDKDFYLIYLGCGEDNSTFPDAYKYKNSWFIKNIMLVINSLFDGASEDNVDYEMETRIGKRYICLDPDLKRPVPIDGSDDKSIENLQLDAESAVKQFDKEIDFISNLIKKKMSKNKKP